MSCFTVIAGRYISSAGRHNFELVNILNFCKRLCLLFSPARDWVSCFYDDVEPSSAFRSSIVNPSCLILEGDVGLSDLSSESDSWKLSDFESPSPPSSTICGAANGIRATAPCWLYLSNFEFSRSILNSGIDLLKEATEAFPSYMGFLLVDEFSFILFLRFMKSWITCGSSLASQSELLRHDVTDAL